MPHHIQPPGVSKQTIAQQIKAANLDGLLLTSPENVYYTSGLPVLPGSGNPILFALKNQLPFFVYIDANGKMTLLCWIGATMGFTFDADDVRSFFNLDSALEELDDFLKATLNPNSKIAVESSCPLNVLSKLHNHIDPYALTLADDILLRLRFIKTERELALMRKATSIVETTVSHLRSQVTTGISRLWLIGEAKRLMLQYGATGIGHTTIAFDTSNPEIAFDETLTANQLVTLDLGAVVDGYTSDNRRLLYTGPIPDDLRKLHTTMCDIVSQVGQALLPGTAFSDLYNLAVDLYAAHELPPFFITVGHSIGLQTEEAWISPDSQTIVQSGMVLNIELYTPYGDGSNIGNEETFLVTDTGVVQLTQTNPAIQSV